VTRAPEESNSDEPRAAPVCTKVETRPPGSAHLTVALLAGAVLLVEIALMRAFAQVTWPPFAYLGVSVAMLGGGASGTLLATVPSTLAVRSLPTLGALLVALSSPLALVVVLTSGLEPLLVGDALGPTGVVVSALLLASLPFVGLGIALSALLERHRAHAASIYGADLLGAAVGVALSLLAIDLFGVLGAALVASAVASFAALASVSSRVLHVAFLLLAIVALSFVDAARHVLPTPTQDKRVGDMPASVVIEQLARASRLVTRDRADARIDVIPASPAPRLLFDFGAAVTRAPDARALVEESDDVTSAAFLARPTNGARVLVIGAGAGYEVARALAFGAAHVDAVEIASGVIDVVRTDAIPTARRVYEDARVRLHHAEARAFVEASDTRFDHIVAIHTITNAALSTGAMRLVEDFLLTRESLRTLFEHLTDDGVLYMTRPASQIPLLVDVARAALVDAHVPADQTDAHLVVMTAEPLDPFFGGLLVFRGPAPETLRLPRGAVRSELPLASSPTVPTDDRPFFHRLSAVVDDRMDARLRIEGPALAERAVALVALLATLLAALVIVLPMRGRRAGTVTLPLRDIAIAAAIGIGFLVVELSLAQRLTLSLGTPLRAFTVVTAAMLVGAGGGALALGRRFPDARITFALAIAGSVSMVMLPTLLPGLGRLSPIMTALLVFVATAIASAPLGLPFPALVSRAPVFTAPWLYATSAVFSVLSSALFALLAPRVGLTSTGFIGVCFYVLAFIAVVTGRRSAPPS
jgi:hypothetical protein